MEDKKNFDIDQYIEKSADIDGRNCSIQIRKGWDFLKDKKSITEEDLCKLAEIMHPDDNQFRNGEEVYFTFRMSDFMGTVKKTGEIIEAKVIASCGSDKIRREIRKWLKQRTQMSPLIAHIRFMYIQPFYWFNGVIGRLLYWWDCQSREMTPALYSLDNVANYYKFFDRKYIKALKNSKWGIDANKPKYEVTIKTKSGKMLRGGFEYKPEEADFKKLPGGEVFDKIVNIKRLK